MPLNKEAFVRYRVINRCLVDGKYATKERLIEACSDALEQRQVGERTIDQDIFDMRYDSRLAFFAPIKFDRFRKAYFYEDDSYSIDKLPVSNYELEALSFAASMLKQYEKVEIFKFFHGALQKIQDAVNMKKMLQSKSEFDFVEFESMPFTKGSEQLTDIIKSIRDKKVLRFDYQRFDAEDKHEHIVHPYYLKEYRNRWYLIGLHHELKQIRTYGLDRMWDIIACSHIPYKITDINFREFFSHTIGVSMPEEEPVDIILRFRKRQGKYILTQPIHESQVILEDNDDHTWVRLFVNINYELVARILGWGPDVMVERPEALKKKIVEIMAETIEGYEG